MSLTIKLLIVSFILAVPPRTIASDFAPYRSPLLLDVTLDNCGFNCVAFTIAYLGINQTATDIQNGLHLDDQLYRSVSLKNVKQYLDNLKINNTVLGGLDVSSLCALLDQNQLAIVHLLSDRGHFIIVAKVSAKYRVVSFPDDTYVTKEQLAKNLGKAMSGYAIIVSGQLVLPSSIKSSIPTNTPLPQNLNQESVHTVATPSIAVPTVHADIKQGSNILYQETIIADPPSTYDVNIGSTLYLTNNGKDPIKILSIVGSCSCFRGEHGPLTLLPGEKKVVKLQFDREHFNYKEGTSVAFRCTDATLPAFVINVLPPPVNQETDNLTNVICIPQTLTRSGNQSKLNCRHVLFLMNSNYKNNLELNGVYDGDNLLKNIKTTYYKVNYGGQMFNVADLELNLGLFSLGSTELMVATNHPRDKRIPIHIIVEKS